MASVSQVNAKALAAIATYGEAATWRSRVASYSPATLTTTEAVTDYAVMVVATAASDPAQAGQRAFVGGDTQTNELLTLYMSASGLAFTPKLGDRVVVRAREYTVLELSEDRMSGTQVLLTVRVGR
jgi:hypothetical protein